jgi:hypothetical protein
MCNRNDAADGGLEPKRAVAPGVDPDVAVAVSNRVYDTYRRTVKLPKESPMAEPKTATRAARSRAATKSSSGGRAGKTRPGRGATTKTGLQSGSAGTRPDATALAGSAPARNRAAAPQQAAGRRPNSANDFEDVTAEVQRRWDRVEEGVPTPPSTLDLDRRASAARSGRAEMEGRRRKHTAASPAITGGDVDADWESAYTVGDEAATGDNPTPDQDRVEDLGRAVGIDYEDTEELKSADKVTRRDRKRWELDPASAEDYKERNRKKG